MQYKNLTGLAIVSLAGLFLMAMSIPESESAPPCDETARKIKKAAKLEARADFYLAIARCLNDTTASFEDCVDEAEDELEESLELVDDQLEARLDLCDDLGHGAYDPQIDPAEFSITVDNSLFPIVPGRIMTYQKVTPEGLEQVVVTHTLDTVDVDGVLCRVIRDVESLNGEVVEDTVDWYAQKIDGSVWYMGEIARNYEDGFLDNLDGSWRLGKDGAKPGIIMLASPQIDDAYRQEFLVNEAEDVAKVISVGNTVTVPAGTFLNCVETEDWTPLEPDAIERKFYAPGIGLVKEVDLETGEVLELIQVVN